MAHNFKLTGDYYVSVDGSDSNDGLTKDTPKRTVQAGLNLMTTTTKTLIIGAGVYNESINKVFNTGTTAYIYADGNVILDGTGKTLVITSGGGGPSTPSYFIGIKIRSFFNGLSIAFTNSGTSHYFQNCIFENCPLVLSGTTNSGVYFTNCLFINSNLSTTTPNSNQLNYCIAINSIINGNINLCTNSYFNSTSAISTLSISAANFNYNNIQGSVIMNTATTVTTGTYQDTFGNYYNLAITTSTGTGTIGDPYGRPLTSGRPFSFTTHRILYPTFNANSISVDPLFNNTESQDFTLQATSPMLGKASNGVDNIGGTKYAFRYAATGDAFNTSAVSISNLALSASNWVVSGGTTGEVISAPILISSVPKVLQKITYNGLLEFDKLITPGTAGNRNVPDQEVYDSTVQPPDVAGANPDRLVYYLRYSTQASQPTADAQWDNGGYWTAGTYNTFEWNTKPSIDTAFVGNGAPTFNSAVTATFLNVTWIQLKVKLRNDYA